MGVSLLTVGLIPAPSASADPTPPHLYRTLAGMGADRTHSIYSAFAATILDNLGRPLIASYDALGSATVTTKDPSVNPACTDILRPNGSSFGRNALQQSLLANDGCWQFARSVSSRGTYVSGISMAWIPFAQEALTFVVRSDGAVPRALTKAEVTAIFKCEVPSFTPELPGPGSGIRSHWLSYLGITEFQIYDGTYPCLRPVADGGTGRPYREENDARGLSSSSVFPVHVPSHLRQSLRLDEDLRGRTVLGSIDGVSPVQVTTDRASDLTFVVHQYGDLTPQLTLAEVREIFRCEALWIDFKPVLPQMGSVTRANWLNLMGITEAMIAMGAYPCLQPVAEGGVGAPYVPEHDARTLERNQVMPYSAAVYRAQAQGVAPDRRGSAVLGVLDGKTPVVTNTAFSGVRAVFTIVPSAKLSDASSSEFAVFVGPTSRVCTQVDLIRLYGFVEHPSCGDTSSRS